MHGGSTHGSDGQQVLGREALEHAEEDLLGEGQQRQGRGSLTHPLPYRDRVAF